MQKNEDIEERMKSLEGAVRGLKREVNSQRKTIDALQSDMGVLEDILGRLTSLEEMTRIARQDVKEGQREIKAEIADAGEQLEERVEKKLEDTIGKKKIVHIKEKKQSWWKKLIGGEK